MSAQFYTLCIEFSAWIAVDFSAQVHPPFFYWLSLVYDVVPAAIPASSGLLQGCHTPRMSSSCGCFYLCTVLLERRVLVCGGGGFDASNGGKVAFHATWRFSVVKVYNVYYTYI